MGSRSEYHCNNCDKDWIEDLQLFYLMSDDRIEEHGILMSSHEIEKRSVAHGWISETFCKNCDKDIKLFLLEEVKTYYPELDPNRLIEEYKHDNSKIFGTFEEYKEGTKVSCPKCNKEIILKHGFSLQDEYILNCNIYEGKCECGKYYSFYAIKPPLRNYTHEEVLEKLEILVDENCIVDLYENYESVNEVNCPCCDNKIPLQNSYDKCPRCDGELEGGLTIMYD